MNEVIIISVWIQQKHILFGNWNLSPSSDCEIIIELKEEMMKWAFDTTDIISMGDLNMHHIRRMRYSNSMMIQIGDDLKIIRIISLAAAAIGFLSLGACKNKNAGYQTTPPVAPGSYIDSGK